MDCRTARLLVSLARPLGSELEADEAEALTNHLADCPDCATIQRSDQAMDERMGRSMRDVPLPAGLRDRLLTHLHVQRGAWYRRRAVRAMAGVAAAVAVALLGWHFWPHTLTQLNAFALYSEANEPPRTGDEVVQLFRSQGVAVELPSTVNLNYALVSRAYLGELQGQRVPIVEFRLGAAFLRVYILNGQRFDLGFLLSASLSGQTTVEARIAPDGRFGYLLEYTGGALDLFLARDLPPAA